jgi:DNA-binding MarR family transcriptional regulator
VAEAGADAAAGVARELNLRAVEHLLGYLLAQAEVPTRRSFQRHIGEPFALRPVEFTLLALLMGGRHALPKQIGAALQLPAPHVTTLVDRLVERGLIERHRHPGDGRAVQVQLTRDGEALAQASHAMSQTMEDGALAALSVTERRQLRRLLLKLAQAGSTEPEG